MTIKPLAGYIVVEPYEKDEEVTAGGLYLPEKAKEKPAKGKVLSVGAELEKENKDYLAVPVKVGDNVIFHRWSGQDVQDGDKKYKLVKFTDLMAIYK